MPRLRNRPEASIVTMQQLRPLSAPWTLGVFLCLCLVWLPNQVRAQGAAAGASGNEPGGAEGPNNMTRAAVQRGILQCAARVEQVSKFTGFGPQVGGMLMAPANPTDQRLFALQMEVPAGAAVNSLVDMNFAPNQANGCGASYAAVSYWAQSCDQVASQQFAQLKRLQPLQRDVAVLDGGTATKVFLMRAGNSGCVSIKKEIVL